MKKVLIDCGGNLGQGYDQITTIYSDVNFDEVHIFEPNPLTFKFLLNKKFNHNVVLHQQAVYGENTTKSLTIEFDPSENVRHWVGGATNVLEEKFVKPDYIADEYIKTNVAEITCIDLSEWLSNSFSPDDFIILKLDCEGCEYEILDKMISDDTLKYVDQIIVEWHNHLRNDYVKSNLYYIKKFKEHGIGYTEWF